ncbi:MAG: hypothetical protein P4L41_13220 [Flavipsychrobacter sp.]|nr:hypothetical protein [Flavipsychrobacter sp.]
MDPRIAILSITPALLFALIFGIVYLKSRENMALIERGINPKKNVSEPRPFVNLKYGLLLTGAGLGLIAAYVVDVIILRHGIPVVNNNVFDRYGYGHPYQENSPAIYFSLIAIGGGLGLIIAYVMEKKLWFDKIKKQEQE